MEKCWGSTAGRRVRGNTMARTAGYLLFVLIAALLLFPLSLWSLAHAAESANRQSGAEGKTFKLYFLGGQSNMGGLGDVSLLPDELKGEQSGVYIFHGSSGNHNAPVDGRGVWARLRPGHGAGFHADFTGNQYTKLFGPELTFGEQMSKLNGDGDIAILKYARGGTALRPGAAPGGTWSPDYFSGNAVSQYDHLLAAIEYAMSAGDVDGDGVRDTLIPTGIVWFQGEGDAAHTVSTANGYGARLKRFIDLLRAALRTDDLPAVIVQVSDSGMAEDGKLMDHVDIVRDAQAAFAKQDPHAKLLTTDGYKFLKDGWHLDSNANIDLGRQMADSLYEMEVERARQ